MRALAKPRLLVAVSGNLTEWREAFTQSLHRPRLPLPYAFGAACEAEGFELCAIDLTSRTSGCDDTAPFSRVFRGDELAEAVHSAELALLSGRHGVRAILRQAWLPFVSGRRVALFSYTWQGHDSLSVAHNTKLRMTRFVARRARCLVLMTGEQAEAARRRLPPSRPVVELRVGIDHAFYSLQASASDVPEEYRDVVERLLEGPYAILPGGQQRLNRETLKVFERSSIRLLRVAQSGQRSGAPELKSEAERRGMSDRIIVLEKIDYAFLRFLLQHAAAYAGIVDSTWQPAGWTTACESLASGTPVVAFEGLVSRELARMKPSRQIVRAVPMGDTEAFRRELEELACSTPPERRRAAEAASAFARMNLDLENTGRAFARQLASAFNA